MKLFIAEKPAVANDIVKALGGNFTRHDGWFESDNAIVTNCFGHIIESQPPENYNRDCSPPCRARLPTSQAATVCATDLRWPPWAETTSPAAFSSSIPFCRMLSAALISRSCSSPHSEHRQMRLLSGISGIL